MATRLFVGNLPENSKEPDVHAAFSCYGKVTSLDLKSKSKSGNESENKMFAFVTISGSNYDIESCIKHFSNEDFNGNRLYVTRARESFLERLQRERLEAQQKDAKKIEAQEVKNNPIIEVNSHKRKIYDDKNTNQRAITNSKMFLEKNESNYEQINKYLESYPALNKKKKDSKLEDKPQRKIENEGNTKYKAHSCLVTSENVVVAQNGEANNKKQLPENVLGLNKKKQDSDIKRIAAMKKKRQEFKEKQMILKTGLTGVDKIPNKRIIFSDNEDDTEILKNYDNNVTRSEMKNTLFDDDEESGDELNFEIKKQFEGKKGQKVLDLQSKYKSDKRFVLDERFMEDEEDTDTKAYVPVEDEIEINQSDEKDKQLNILQDVLGVPIRRKVPEEERDSKKNKRNLGMLRFDPTQPEHAKFLAPVENTKQESTKKSKKKKDKQTEDIAVQEQKQEEQRPEVSKEQFYKVSETLKEAIAQSTTFSLRSLFGNNETVQEMEVNNADYIPLEPLKKSKVKNPLEPAEKNPFVYDSSDSEPEEIEQELKTETPFVTENKAIWKENFFFSKSDQRFEEGLVFFNQSNETETHKERRELKSLMKKRIYNKERKDQMQMFRKKIGGRKKTMKKSFRRKT